MCDHDRISIILASLGQVSAGLAAGPPGADWWLVPSSVGDASSCGGAAGYGSMGSAEESPRAPGCHNPGCCRTLEGAGEQTVIKITSLENTSSSLCTAL